MEIQIKKASQASPRDLVVIAQPKMGKSAILADLSVKKNAVILGLEKGGYEYLTAKVLDIYDSQESTIFDAYLRYIEYRNQLLENKGQFEFLAIDVLTELDRLAEIGGTLEYMYKVPMGKNFNKDPRTGEKYPWGHPEFKSVLTLPDGAGYNHTRKWFMDQIEIFSQIAPYRIYVAHVADKYVKDGGREDVVGSEIALTGKLKSIFSARVTTLCKLVADRNDRFLSFDVANDSIIAGSRAPWLKGQIKFSSLKDDGTIETYWESIYK